ncbi:ANK2 [Symbiodinium natans]|uniref:ANK2 protein n=1 Tax=Symbiodinium natans TaxID=878477 RepID=A0A812HII6_9DINO|nr:ANK2 [Symbiodinium natans]
MLRVWSVSGEELAALPLEQFSFGDLEASGAETPAGQPVRALKRCLSSFCGHSRFRQRLVDENGAILDDSTPLARPLDLQLLLLPLVPTTQADAAKLASAVGGGHLELVEEMLHRPIDPDCMGRPSETALMFAASRGKCDMAALLLEAGANKDATNRLGRTPLFAAALMGHVEVSRLLLEARAEVDKADKDGQSPLYMACSLGSVAVARLLLEAGAEKDLMTERRGDTPLLSAASQPNRQEVLSLLLQASADKDRASRSGDTPLLLALSFVIFYLQGCFEFCVRSSWLYELPRFMAAERGHLENVKILLQAGADRGWFRHLSATPHHVASRNGHVEIARLLLDPSCCTPAHWLNQAAQSGDSRAQYQIARMFLYGTGLEADEATAAQWASAAANSGLKDHKGPCARSDTFGTGL